MLATHAIVCMHIYIYIFLCFSLLIFSVSHFLYFFASLFFKFFFRFSSRWRILESALIAFVQSHEEILKAVEERKVFTYNGCVGMYICVDIYIYICMYVCVCVCVGI